MDVPVAIDRRPGKEILLHGARERIVGDIGSVSRHRFKIDHAGVALACRQHHCKADPTEPAILVASNLRAVSSTKCRRDFASLEKSLVALRAMKCIQVWPLALCCQAMRSGAVHESVAAAPHHFLERPLTAG